MSEVAPPPPVVVGQSPAVVLISRLVSAVGAENAHRVLDVICDQLTNTELAALAYDWEGTWARPKQIAPKTDWRSWGFFGGRGFGKTRSVAEWINGEVRDGRAWHIALCAQNEDNTIKLQVSGISGLIETAPPWFKPRWIPTTKNLLWPNGALGYVLTPEAPQNIRGFEFDIAWLCEIQSWPAATRDEAYANFLYALRQGYARMVWDATPRRGHPILRRLLDRSAANPDKHVVVRGTMYENAANLTSGVVEELEAEMGGTQRGREELFGEDIQDAENSVAHQEWIDDHRRPMPDRFVYRGIGVDPAVTSKRTSDRSGIVEAGRGVDGQGYVIRDMSGKHPPHAWAKIVLDTYVNNHCDIVVVETNKGGELVTQNLRAAAAERKLTVVVVGKKERPHHQRGIVHVKEIYSKGDKLSRAQPLSTAYERGRVSHVLGAGLTTLELTLTTWEPTPNADSPDDLDALNSIMSELLDLTEKAPDRREGFKGIEAAAERLIVQPTPRAVDAILGRGRRGDRI